jgi:hypothetical protein
MTGMIDLQMPAERASSKNQIACKAEFSGNLQVGPVGPHSEGSGE